MKTVLITGAAGGLGICLAREYLSRGYMVFGVDVVQQHSETDRLFEEANGQFVFLHADVSDSSSVQHMAEYVGAKTEALDILVNCAGIIRPESEYLLEDFDIDGSMNLFNVNALGPLRVTKACIGLLRKGHDKLLVNI